MTTEQNDSIAYEIAMLVKENRELRSQNMELEGSKEELKRYIEELLHKIEVLTRSQTEDTCQSDIKAGDKVVIHTKSKTALICDGFVLTVSDKPWYHRSGGYMVLPCRMVNADGSPRTGIGAIHSFRSGSYSWEKVDPDTPVTTILKVGLEGTEQYNCMTHKLSFYEKYTAHYTNLYGGKSDSRVINSCLYPEKSNE